MVAAYLQGLLKPKLIYGRRSALSEDVILEAVAAQDIAQDMAFNIEIDVAALPVLNEKGIRGTLDSVRMRAERLSQLKMVDIYCVEQQLRERGKLENKSGSLSLYQLYLFAEKSGILDAMAKHDSGREKESLL